MLGLQDVSVSPTTACRPSSTSTSRCPTARCWPCSGPSGCGKSTLLRAVAGLEPLTAGAVTLGRRRPGRRTDPQARVRADVPGRPAVPAPDRGPQRRLRTQAAPRRPASRRGWPSCSTSSGWRGYGGRLPATLSGGERQRVALARALAVVAAPAAARRAALGARRRPARTPGRRPARHPACGRDDRADGHPRPRGGVHRRRPAGGDARRPGRAGGPDRARSGARRPTRRRRCSSAMRGCCATRPPRRVLRGRRPPPAPAVAVRRSALVAGPRRVAAGVVVSSRATPEQIRLVVDVPGVGERRRRGSPGQPSGCRATPVTLARRPRHGWQSCPVAGTAPLLD